MFDADRPITKSSQDRLNRSLFAKYLARCLLDHKNPESLVVGLFGGWGVGKTSLINLVIEELNVAGNNSSEEEKPIILNFSPWSYSGQNQMIYSFFRRLIFVLRDSPYLQNSERIIYLLELYVSFFTNRPIPTAFAPKLNYWQKLTSSKEASLGWESGRDLTQVKAELNELLSQQRQKIIIIIDNISRLYDYEIKEIFQIVKSMGDYANTAYVLAFDKEHIIQSIDQLEGGSGGAELIEKLVQLPFDIPPIQQHELENIFADRLHEVIKSVPEDTWNTEYWADIYYTSLRYFFNNCRDISRYVNILNFSYQRVRDVVNPVDFFALSAIEVFIPDVYYGIRDNKDLFTDLLEHVYVLDKELIHEDKGRCEEILARNNQVPRQVLLDLLILLFPRIRRIYHPDEVFYHSDSQARRLRKLCDPDLFEVYFRLSMQTGEIPKAEFETLLSLSADTIAFDQAITRLNKDDRILQFLDQLDSKAIQSIPRHNVEAIITALLDNGDLFPQGFSGPLSLDTPMRIHRIIHELLRKLPSTEERFLVLQNAIAKTNKSLYSLVHELKEQSREHFEDSDTFVPLEFRDVTPEELESLRKLVAMRIEEWAEADRLYELPHLIPILYAWKTWGDERKCLEFVEKMTNTDRGLLAFLQAALKNAIDQAITVYEKNPAWAVYLNDIDAFIPTKRIEKHAKQLFEDLYFDKLREREQLALMIFLDLIHASTTKIIPQTSD